MLTHCFKRKISEKVRQKPRKVRQKPRKVRQKPRNLRVKNISRIILIFNAKKTGRKIWTKDFL